MKLFVKIAFLLLAAFAVAACSGPKNTPEGVATAFVERVYKGDADGAIKLTHLPDDSKPGEAEMMQGKIKSMLAESKAMANEKGGVKEISVLSSEIDSRDPNRARVSLKVTFNQAGEKMENVELIQIEGKWKVGLW